MERKMIAIDEEKCNGCGLCVTACHEGALQLENGKAKIVRDDYCDGLGNCLPVCPTGAISFEVREAAPFDEEAVKRKQTLEKEKEQKTLPPLPCGCPGTQSKSFKRAEKPVSTAVSTAEPVSRLSQWPVQLKLVPVNAPYFEGAKVMIAADCAAYAYGNFHEKFIKGKVVLIGCPKLDEGDYSDKLTEIFKRNNIKSVTVVRMEVPCCGGLANAAVTALKNCGKMIPWEVVTVSTDGELLE